MMTNLWKGALTAAALTALIASPARADVDGVLKIGFVTTLSGPNGVIGNLKREALDLALEKLGGQIGGKKTEILVRDDQLRPELAVQLVDELINREKVDVVMGVIFSNVMMAIAKPVLDGGAMILSTNAGPSPLAGARCHPNFFGVAFQNDGPHEAAGQYVQSKNWGKVFVMAPNYQAGKDAIAGFRRMYKGEVVGELFTQINQPDYQGELSQIRRARPDAVFAFYPGGMGITFIRQWKQAGLTTPLVTTWALEAETLPSLGEVAKGMASTQLWAPNLPNAANVAFVADYRKKFGYDPSTYGANTYDTVMLLDGAIKQAGADWEKPEALRAALKTAPFQSVRGNFKFAANQFPVQDYYLRDTVAGADGKLTLSAVEKVLTNHGDAYAGDCPMK